MPRDGRTEDRSARGAPDLAPRHRSRRAEGSLPPAAGRAHRLSRRRQRARSAARPPSEGLRHRHLGASVSGQEALPELLDHRPPLPARARQVRTEGDRGRDVPPSGRGGRGGRAGRRAGARSDDARRRTAHPPRQHVRHAGGRRVPPRLHDQRALLRHRDLLGHRLRRRPRGSARRRRALDRRSRRPAARGSGAHAARDRARRAARLHDRAAAARRDPHAPRTRSRRARRRGCSRSTTRFCAPDRPRRHSASWRRSACSSRSPPSCTTARPIRCGDRSPRSTRTAGSSSRRPTRCRTRSCSAACSCRSGISLHPPRHPAADQDAADGSTGIRREAAAPSAGPRLGELPLARRDVERLRQIISLQRRLRDLTASAARAARADAPRHLPRGADLDGDPRRRAGRRRALDGDPRRGRRRPSRVRGQRRRPAADCATPSMPHETPAPAQAPRPPRRRRRTRRRASSDVQRNTATRARCGSLRYASGGDFFDRLVRLRELQRNQQLDDRPGGIDLARPEAELRAARIAVMVVVQPLAAGDQRERADVGRGVVEVLVADVVAEAVDRRRQHEHVHHRVNARREQRPPHADHRADDRGTAARCRSRDRGGRG